MRLALAQLNPLVGDLEGNGARLEAACAEAVGQGAQLLVTSELMLWGYPARDLLLRPALVDRQQAVLSDLCQRLDPRLAVLVGLVESSADPDLPNLHNAVALIHGGGWRVVARKQLLPSYDVFDERRYFRPGHDSALLELELDGRSWRLGLTICVDLWVEPDLAGQRLRGGDPIAALEPLRPELLLNLSASPFGIGKAGQRRQLAAAAARRLGCPVVYVNQVGGNDDLVFDGASFVVDETGALLTQLPWTREAVVLWQTPQTQPTPPPPTQATEPAALEQLFRVLVLGVGDYARKCGFRSALLGLSGGIESALVATIAAAALGADQVHTLLLPSPYSSRSSIDDALALGQRLGLQCRTVPIAPLMEGFQQALEPVLAGGASGVTAENLQSRIRGTLLMAVANQQGHLLLSTGNKSELAVGYCTLYGDMNGGLAVIGDLYKTTVFQLCAWLDSPEAGPCRQELGLPPAGPLIGAEIRNKPPSAELRPDQRDSDSLPDYPLLDQVLKGYIEELRSPEALVATGLDRPLVERIHQLLRRAEFKRRQAPPLLKVSRRAFGNGWRMPIAAR
ncbi:MAG: NAD+ synthase [Cyanobacteriota bacterium]